MKHVNSAAFFRLRVVTMALALVAVSSCDPLAKLSAGPFSGQIVDAQSCRPVPKAFVAFTWGGSSWIEGHAKHLLDVLVQADAEGRYQLPWQGDKLDTMGWHSVAWSQAVWAPGYLLLDASENMSRKQCPTSGVGLQIRLTRAASAVDALTMRNRMDPSSYENRYNKHSYRNAPVLQSVALALYRDSYHRVCEDELSDDALAKQYVEALRADVSKHRYFARRHYSAKEVAAQSDAWAALDRRPGGPTHPARSATRRRWTNHCYLSCADSVALLPLSWKIPHEIPEKKAVRRLSIYSNPSAKITSLRVTVADPFAEMDVACETPEAAMVSVWTSPMLPPIFTAKLQS